MSGLGQAVPEAPLGTTRRSLFAPVATLIARARLVAVLRRLAAVLSRSEPQGAWPAELLSLARRARRRPGEIAEEVLALYDRREPFDALGPGQPLRRVIAVARLRWRLYRRALALWHATKTGSPLDAVDDGGPVALLADYGGGCEVWRCGRAYLARYDVGAHVSCWREDRIGRREAEQALLGPAHFTLMITGLQRRLKARGAELYTGSTRPLPPPAVG